MIRDLPLVMPRCARCGRTVERIEWGRDIYRDVMVATVFCHGEREQAVLTHCDVFNADAIRVGEAFRPAISLPGDGGLERASRDLRGGAVGAGGGNHGAQQAGAGEGRSGGHAGDRGRAGGGTRGVAQLG